MSGLVPCVAPLWEVIPVNTGAGVSRYLQVKGLPRAIRFGALSGVRQCEDPTLPTPYGEPDGSTDTVPLAVALNTPDMYYTGD